MSILLSGCRTVSPVAGRLESQRDLILDATAELLLRDGAGGLHVNAIMSEAGVSRTAFYRWFTSAHDAVGALLSRLLGEISGGAVDWLQDPGSVGEADVVERNLVLSGRNLAPHAALLSAVVDAAGSDDELRRLWRDVVVQQRIDATEAAIRRDQAAGAIRASLDAADTARALTLMNSELALEVLGRQGGSAEEFARVTAPIWLSVLFGTTD